MATVKLMQGDSYLIPFSITISGKLVTPDMVSDIELTIGSSLRKLYSSGEIVFDKTRNKWFFYPTQQDTFSLEPDGYEVQARIKLPNGDYSPVKGITIGRIVILESQSKEEL